MMRFLLLTIFLFSLTVFAQTQVAPKARMIDEFGSLGECDLGIRLENLRTELSSDETVKAKVIVYQSIDAYPAEYDSNSLYRQIKKQMDFLRLDDTRVAFINGGFRKLVGAELWIVPKGAESPKPSETLPRPIIPTNKTFIFANRGLGLFDYEYPIEFLSISSRKERLKLEREIEEQFSLTKEEFDELKFGWAIDSFGNLLKERETSTGLIIFYADNKYFNIKNIRKHIEEGKRRIAKNAGILTSRISIIYGGYRDYLQAEFWVIPKNGQLPKPKPEKREY